MYRSIQVCRAIAAVMVMLLHLTSTLSAAKYFGVRGIDAPFSFGHAGVEFFFVLSGFIITFVHWKDFGSPSRLPHYLKKRALRIYPAYWLVFAVVYFIAIHAVTRPLAMTPEHLLDTLALLPQASPDPIVGTTAQVLTVAWTLQYEVLFYILMAVFIVSRPAGALLAGAILANLFACRNGHCVATEPYLQTTFLLLFGLGALTAAYCRSQWSLRFPGALAGIGTVVFLAAAAWDDVTGQRLVFLYGLASAAIVLGLVKAEERGSIRITWEWAITLGDASYALYLVHYPLISVLCKIGVKLGLHGAWGMAIASPVIIAACIATAVVFHRLIEIPLLRHFSDRRSPALVVAVGR